MRINKGLSAYGMAELMKAVKQIDGASLLQKNEQFIDYMQNGVTVEAPQPPKGSLEVCCVS